MKVLEFLFLAIGTFFDIRERELPVLFFVCFGILAIVSCFFSESQSVENVLQGVCAGSLFVLIGWITKEAIGYGVGMGLIILGIFEGWPGMIPVVVGAFLLSGVYGLWKLFNCGDSRMEEIPFYPFLLISFIGVLIL